MSIGQGSHAHRWTPSPDHRNSDQTVLGAYARQQGRVKSALERLDFAVNGLRGCSDPHVTRGGLRRAYILFVQPLIALVQLTSEAVHRGAV
ncbi:MAG: hypothetical protein ABJB74_17895 [Gemmatimonas sp.]